MTCTESTQNIHHADDDDDARDVAAARRRRQHRTEFTQKIHHAHDDDYARHQAAQNHHHRPIGPRAVTIVFRPFRMLRRRRATGVQVRLAFGGAQLQRALSSSSAFVMACYCRRRRRCYRDDASVDDAFSVRILPCIPAAFTR